MKTLHCIDVSGSMSEDNIATAKQEMLKRFKRGDVVCVFDGIFHIVTDIDRDFRSYSCFAGVINYQTVLDYAKNIKAETILYSDIYVAIINNVHNQFTYLVKINNEPI